MKSQNPIYQNPLVELLILLLIVTTTALIGSAIGLGLATANGFDLQALLNSLNEQTPIETRNLVRLILLFNQAFTFLVPALIYAYIRYKKDWSKHLNMSSLAKLNDFIIAIIIMLLSIPFVQYVYSLNKLLPLPDWMRNLENDTEALLKGLLQMDNNYEFIFNTIVIALIPAIGEELIFRGILQRKMHDFFPNKYHVAIWISAAIFSAIHFQFEGFFPRMVLGAVLGYLFYFTQNLWIPIIAHFVNNFGQIIAYQMRQKNQISTDIENVEIPWYVGIVSLILVAALLYYLSNGNRKVEIKEGIESLD